MALSKIDVANMLTGLVPNDNTIRRPNATPLIINGDMQVAQRSVSETGKTSADYYTCDRMHSNIDSIGTYTIIQESLSSGNAYINGFTKAWRIDTTTADASPASGDNFSFIYSFEGQDLQLFKKGTANAEKFTLAFWVKSNKTGTGNVNLFDTDNTRLIGGTYTISSADTWEHKVVNFAADTTGVFTNDNGQSLKIEWFLDSGTNFSSGTTDTAWGSKQDVDRNASGTLQIARNTANDWAITGIQLEVGEYSSTTLPPFQHETFEDNLARCQRYYTLISDRALGDFAVLGLAVIRNAANCTSFFAHPVTMRTQPSIVEHNTDNVYRQNGTGNSNNDGTAPTIDQGNIQGTSISINGFSGLTSGQATTVKIHSGGKLGLKAEL